MLKAKRLSVYCEGIFSYWVRFEAIWPVWPQMKSSILNFTLRKHARAIYRDFLAVKIDNFTRKKNNIVILFLRICIVGTR